MHQPPSHAGVPSLGHASADLDRPTLSAAEAIADVRQLAEIYTLLEDGAQVTERLYQLLLHAPTGGKQVHDANIVATMLAHGVARLLTFNVADFQRFVPLIELITAV